MIDYDMVPPSLPQRRDERKRAQFTGERITVVGEGGGGGRGNVKYPLY